MKTLLIRQIAVASLLAYAFRSGFWHCQAASYTWNGSGDWSVPSNWTPSGVPGSVDTATIGGGTVTVSTDTTVSNLNLTGGTIAGGAVLIVASNFTWTSGGMDGGGTTRLLVGCVGVLSGAASKNLENGRRWENAGTLTWEDGDIVAGGVGNNVFDNQVGATFNITAASRVFRDNCNHNLLIQNEGTIRRSSGSGTVTLAHTVCYGSGTLHPVTVINSGLIEVLSGTLQFGGRDTNGFTQAMGLLFLNGGNVSSTLPLLIFGGTVAGTGVINASLTNNAVVSPGVSPGLLTINGNYTQTALGTLNIEISGTAPATGFDRLAVSGTATLAGTLITTLTNGFYPATNASFTFLTAPSVSGAFATFNYPSNDVGLQVNYAMTSAGIGVINVRPVIPLINSQTNDELVVFSLPVNATDDDLPAQTLTYALTNSPAGAAINSSSGVISWTPTEVQGPMTTDITVQVTDNGTPNLTVRRTFQIVVNEINVAPVLTLPANQSINEQTLLTVHAAATDSDLPINPLTFELVSGPPGLTVSTNGDIAWSPLENQGPNVYTVTVRVVDSNTNAVNEQHLSTTNSFQVTIREVNLSPVLTVPTNQVMIEMTTLNVNASATDPDIPLNPLTFSLASAPVGMTIDANTGAISWTPTEAQGPGSNLVAVVVTDDSPLAVNTQHLSATNTFSVTVFESNRPPILTVPANQVMDEMTTLNVSASATDPDIPVNPLTFSLASAPVGMTIDANSGAITWTPTEAQGLSSNFVLVVVTDLNTNAVNQQQLSVTNGFSVVVREVNLSPVLTVPANQVLDEMTVLNVSASATDPDIPANALTFSLVAAPVGMTLNTNTGAITWTPTEAQGLGSNLVAVVVTDDSPVAVNTQHLSVTNTFVVIVLESNRPPFLTVPTNQVLDEMTTMNVSASATDPDIPANPVAFSLVAAPVGMTIDANTGAITWTPAEAQGPSSNFVLVVVTDLNTNAANPQQLSVTNGFSVVVNEVNSRPVLNVPADQVIHATARLLTLATATDVDIPTNTIVFGLVSGPTGLTVSESGLVNWRPGDTFAGTTNGVSIYVLDNGSPAMAATQSFNVIVVSRPILSPPVIAGEGVTLSWSAISGTSYRLQFTPALSQEIWTDLAGDVTAGSTNATKADPAVNTTNRLYRVQVLP